MNIIVLRKHIVNTVVLNDFTCTNQNVITRGVIRFLRHDVIRWQTATSFDNYAVLNTAQQVIK